MLIVRENTEGEYVGLGGRIFVGTDSRDRLPHLRLHPDGDRASRRLRVPCRPGGGLVTSVTKSNALPHTMGLWDDVTDDVASRYPDQRWERMHVDAVGLPDGPRTRAVRRARRIQPLRRHPQRRRRRLAGHARARGKRQCQPASPASASSSPSTAARPTSPGRGIANPLGAISSAAMLLDYLGATAAARAGAGRAVDARPHGAESPRRTSAADARRREMGDEIVARVEGLTRWRLTGARPRGRAGSPPPPS